MSWAGKPHPIEALAERGAPLVLAGAAGWAAFLVRLPIAAIAAAGFVALALGAFAMRLAGAAPRASEATFEPAEFEPDADEDVLLLDDPLVEVASDSRVVKLFARNDPTPGELVLRISDYLSEQGKSPVPADQPMDLLQVDASAALHAALANIRASLR
jgi:hypothetical protein